VPTGCSVFGPAILHDELLSGRRVSFSETRGCTTRRDCPGGLPGGTPRRRQPVGPAPVLRSSPAAVPGLQAPRCEQLLEVGWQVMNST